MPFEKKNYQFMLLGIGCIIVGFYLMYLDSTPQGYSTLSMVIAPSVIMLGFLIEFLAIFLSL